MTDRVSPQLTDSADRRWAPRREIGSTSTLRDPFGAPLAVTVSDLSVTGFSFTADKSFPVGASVRLGIPGVGRANAIVCRKDGDLHGCEFDAPLRQSQIDAAFGSPNVFEGAFATELTETGSFPEPAVGQWSGLVRVGVIVGLSAAIWAAIWALVQVA